MGISISASGRPSEMPLPLVIVLECDAAESLFCRGFEQFDEADGFVVAHTLAMARGWLERQAPQGRLWICPACSGKT